MSAAALALHHGPAIYQAPVNELCHQPQSFDDPLIPRVLAVSQELAVAPVDVCFVRDEWTRVPLVVNWGMFPRPYPPGNALVFAPIGWLYASGALSFTAACGWTMFMILVFGHLAVLALGFSLGIEERAPAVILCTVAAGLMVMCWTFAGFYDGLAIAPLCLAGWAWRRDRPALALMFFGLACFAHYRALWFLPLGLAAMGRCWQLQRDGQLSPRGRQQAGVGLLAGALAALALYWVAPHLTEFPVNHALQSGVLAYAPGPLLAMLGGLVVVAGATALRGDLVLGLCGLWMLIMTVASPQAMPWHAASLVPLLALVPSNTTGARRRAAAYLATLVFIEVAAQLLFGSSLWPEWLQVLAYRI